MPTILKEISKARKEFHNKYGRYPSRLIACPQSFQKIKERLFHGSHINTKDLPLNRYDQMELIVVEDYEGWYVE